MHESTKSGDQQAVKVYNNGMAALLCNFIEHLCHHYQSVAPGSTFSLTFFELRRFPSGRQKPLDLLAFKIERQISDENWQIRFECLGFPRIEIGGTTLTILRHLTDFLATIEVHALLSIYDDADAVMCNITTKDLRNRAVLELYIQQHAITPIDWMPGELLSQKKGTLTVPFRQAKQQQPSTTTTTTTTTDNGRKGMPLPADIWLHDILPYLNTDNRAKLRGTGRIIAKRIPQTPVCTPWMCVWRPTLCSNNCDTFWLNTEKLLTDFLQFLHGWTHRYRHMVVRFEMGSKLLLVGWEASYRLFLREEDNPALVLQDQKQEYYEQVITHYFNEIKTQQTAAANEDEEPFKLQLTIQNPNVLGQPRGPDLSYLHEAVRAKFCRPQPLMGNLYVYDVSTDALVSILITDYPPTKVLSQPWTQGNAVCSH